MVFLDQAVECFQTKLGKARVLVQWGVDDNYSPSVLHVIINMNRTNSSTVNEIRKNKKQKLSERQYRPLGKEGVSSVIA